MVPKNKGLDTALRIAKCASLLQDVEVYSTYSTHRDIDVHIARIQIEIRLDDDQDTIKKKFIESLDELVYYLNKETKGKLFEVCALREFQFADQWQFYSIRYKGWDVFIMSEWNDDPYCFDIQCLVLYKIK